MNTDSAKLPNGNVLLKPRFQNDKIKLKSGGELYIDTAFLDMEHTDIIADVIKVPDVAYAYDLEMRKKPVPIEIKPGDVVYCYYLAIHNALKRVSDGRRIIENGEIYLLINYVDNLYMALRDDFPIMVNDYVLIEPTYRELKEMQEKAKKQGIEVPGSAISHYQENTQWGIVRYAGRNLSPETFKDEDQIVGKEVFMRKHADIPLEYEYHRTFEPEKKLFRVRRRDILVVLD